MDLKPYLSFGNSVECKQLIPINNIRSLHEQLLKYPEAFILGGGSNLLFKGDTFDGAILKMEILGKETIVDEADYAYVEIGAGESWHETVMWAVENDLGGIENLSLIPGTVGAAPIQNIGAYGVELKDVLHSVEAYDKKQKALKTFHASECNFSYRDSIFKSSRKGDFVICSVVLKLKKHNHKLHISYGAIKEVLEKDGLTDPTIKQVSDAVIKIRSSKLPDPKVLGNSGSFFKNPVVSKEVADKLLDKYPTMPHYSTGDDLVKIPAGWLIEKSGWKGKRVGNTGCYEKQALVIVNYGNATGNEIYNHAIQVKKSVMEIFGIEIVPEVNLIE